MNQSKNFDFFSNNELRINKLVCKMFSVGILTGPLMLVARYLRIFPQVNYSSILLFTLSIAILSLIQYVFLHSHPYSKVTKYFSFIGLEFLLAILSVQYGLCIFIGYAIIPILSCIYYNKHFTCHMIFLGWITMIISLFIRSQNNLPLLEEYLSGWQWFLAFSVGCSIEYFIISLISYNISKTTKETLNKQYIQSNKINLMKSQLITGFANLVESKDVSTGTHIKRTKKYVSLICNKLLALDYYTDFLTDENIYYMVEASPLHDLGKLNMPDYILSKPSILTNEEFKIVKNHPLFGVRLIEKNLSDLEDEKFIEFAKEMALCHHEWWNGQGYPLHLVGTEIPLPARIMAVADVLDALLTVRPYKSAIPLHESLALINQLAGTQFDPAIVEAVELLRDEIKEFISTEPSCQQVITKKPDTLS